jgi:hypothetical protein
LVAKKLKLKVVKNRRLAWVAEFATRGPPQAFDLFSLLLEV